MHRFLCPEAPFVAGGEITLSPDESHHLVHVMRLFPGETVSLADGRGKTAVAILLTCAARGARVRVESVSESTTPSSRVRLAFGIPKPAALEFILRRATEVGVELFQPLVTQHSLAMNSWNDRRWGKIILEVCKQCQETRFPEILAPVPLERWLGAREARRLLVLCDEEQRNASRNWRNDVSGYDLLIGPEGGWSREEVAWLERSGAAVMGLGNNRLRAETAALVATVLVKKQIGEI